MIKIILGVSIAMTALLIYMLKYHTKHGTISHKGKVETKETKRRHDNINHFHNSTISNDELPDTHVQGAPYEKGYYEDR